MPLDYDFNSLATFTPEHFNSLSEVLSPDLIDKRLKESGIVTLRKRRLPLERWPGVLLEWLYLDIYP